MLISALPAASAAEKKSLSDSAGETVVVHVTHVAADGELTETYVDVAIPEDATCEDEHELIHAAAIATVKPVTRSADDFDFVLHGANISLTTTFKHLEPIYLYRDYSYLLFEFNGGSYSGNPTNLTLRLTNDSSQVFTLNAPITSTWDGLKHSEVIIYDGRTYNGITASLPNGGYFDPEAKVNNGSASFTGFIVKGYY